MDNGIVSLENLSNNDALEIVSELSKMPDYFTSNHTSPRVYACVNWAHNNKKSHPELWNTYQELLKECRPALNSEAKIISQYIAIHHSSLNDNILDWNDFCWSEPWQKERYISREGIGYEYLPHSDHIIERYNTVNYLFYMYKGKYAQDDDVFGAGNKSQMQFYEYYFEKSLELLEYQFDFNDKRVIEILREMSLDPISRMFVEYLHGCFIDAHMHPEALWQTLELSEKALIDTVEHTWEELDAAEDRQIEWLVDGVFARNSSSILAGVPKVGKSSLIRWLIYCLVTGDAFLGCEVPNPLDVCYFCLEDPDYVFKYSMRKLLNREESLPKRGDLKIRFTSDHKFMNYFRDACEKNDFVIVDTLVKVLDIEDTNSYSQVGKAMGLLTDIAKRSGCHVLFIHHNNKSSRSIDTGQGMMGSTAFAANCEHNISITLDNKNERYITSQNRINELLGGKVFTGQTLNVDRSSYSFSLSETPNKSAKNMLKALKILKIIIDIVREKPETKTNLRQLVSDETGGCDRKLVDGQIDYGLEKEFLYRKSSHAKIGIHPRWRADMEGLEEVLAELEE